MILQNNILLNNSTFIMLFIIVWCFPQQTLHLCWCCRKVTVIKCNRFLGTNCISEHHQNNIKMQLYKVGLNKTDGSKVFPRQPIISSISSEQISQTCMQTLTREACSAKTELQETTSGNQAQEKASETLQMCTSPLVGNLSLVHR